MRIAYLARWDVSHESGILKKMTTQIRVWLRLGHDVRFFVFSPGESTWEGLADIPATVYHGDDLWRRITSTREVSSSIFDWDPDIAYVRWSTYYPAWEAVMRRVPAVVELNGDDVRNNRLTLPFPLYIAHRVTRGRLLRRARGFVSVSRDLASSAVYSRFGVPVTVIGNGVDLATAQVFPAPYNTTPRLIFLGYGGVPWHGLDKIELLAGRCPDWHIDVVGTDTPQGPGSAMSNLKFHGQLAHDQYLALLRRADVAIGSLAFHRQGISSTSAIKAGEYLAHGIPTIIGYEETDFPDGHPLLLQLPNTEDNVAQHIEEIRAFVDRARGERVERSSVRHLDVSIKERARLEFMSRFAGW